MWRRAFVLCALLVVAGSLACTRRKGVTEPESEPGILMPLAVGNEWTYRVPVVETAGQKTYRTFTVRITGTREIGGEVYYVSEDDTYYRNRSDGLFTGLYDEYRGRFFDDLFFQFPVEAGTRYTYVSQETGNEIEVEVRRAAITVPAGAFDNCYVYEFIGPESPPRFYFEPGIGLLKAENFDQPGDTFELVAYKLR